MIRPVLFAAIVLSIAAPAFAQDATPQGLSIELNAATNAESGGCTFSFLIENGTETEIDSAVFEAVLFDDAGQVDRLTLFDFGALPQGRPRVRQFTVPGRACEDFGRVLFNGVHACDAGDAGPAVCAAGLTVGTRTEIEVIG
ncbi:hypothetical protein [Palleronia abyssalis]|uniref:Tat pathway signal sequence domain protein n=1 Tax=Palleronia abyssalis TaxID=1501240 RepID=A0A2R8BR48_9RHOB|nr:hypothetical protein [Palleronia abyssalis]SPJ22588.1 hypothetical protein PAA8504_00383 [Palleronia abyssalis]